jgi:hypothetical protein
MPCRCVPHPLTPCHPNVYCVSVYPCRLSRFTALDQTAQRLQTPSQQLPLLLPSVRELIMPVAVSPKLSPPPTIARPSMAHVPFTERGQVVGGRGRAARAMMAAAAVAAHVLPGPGQLGELPAACAAVGAAAVLGAVSVADARGFEAVRGPARVVLAAGRVVHAGVAAVESTRGAGDSPGRQRGGRDGVADVSGRVVAMVVVMVSIVDVVVKDDAGQFSIVVIRRHGLRMSPAKRTMVHGGQVYDGVNGRIDGVEQESLDVVCSSYTNAFG